MKDESQDKLHKQLTELFSEPVLTEKECGILEGYGTTNDIHA